VCDNADGAMFDGEGVCVCVCVGGSSTRDAAPPAVLLMFAVKAPY